LLSPVTFRPSFFIANPPIFGCVGWVDILATFSYLDCDPTPPKCLVSKVGSKCRMSLGCSWRCVTRARGVVQMSWGPGWNVTWAVDDMSQIAHNLSIIWVTNFNISRPPV
jgi:hypothetical protein